MSFNFDMTTNTHPTYQESLAINFWNKNSDLCNGTRSRVLQAAGHFIAVYSKDYLPAKAVEAARQALQISCISAFVSAIRPYAASFVEHRASSIYWAMVDAANHFCDATSAYWQYMTYEGRLRHLEWAVMEAERVSPSNG